MFINMIKAFTVLKFRRRKMEKGSLIARKEDFEDAMELYNEIRGEVDPTEDERTVWQATYNKSTQKTPQMTLDSRKIGYYSAVDIAWECHYPNPEKGGAATVRKAIDVLMKKLPPHIFKRKTVKSPEGKGGQAFLYRSIHPPDEKITYVRWKKEET
jgi:hypothetical protein